MTIPEDHARRRLAQFEQRLAYLAYEQVKATKQVKEIKRELATCERQIETARQVVADFDAEAVVAEAQAAAEPQKESKK